MEFDAKTIPKMSLAKKIEEREAAITAIAGLEWELKDTKAYVAAINQAIAEELGLTSAPSEPSRPQSERRRMSARQLEAAQDEVLDIIQKADSPVSRGDIALRMDHKLQPNQISNILRLLKDQGSIKQHGERRDTRYTAA